MQDDMDGKKSKKETELEQMRAEIKSLRKALAEMEEMLNKPQDEKTNDELKAEIEHLREQIDRMESRDGSVNYDIPKVKNAPNHALPITEDQDEEEKEEL